MPARFGRTARSAMLLGAVAVALTIAGCSDGGEGSGTTAGETTSVTDAETIAPTSSDPTATDTAAAAPDGEVSVEEYVAAADAICRETNEELSTLPEPSTPEELAQGVRQGKVIAERQLARLRALEVPDVLADSAAEAYAVLEQQIARLDAVADAADDRERLDALIRELEALDAKADALATEIGLVECGNDS